RRVAAIFAVDLGWVGVGADVDRLNRHIGADDCVAHAAYLFGDGGGLRHVEVGIAGPGERAEVVQERTWVLDRGLEFDVVRDVGDVAAGLGDVELVPHLGVELVEVRTAGRVFVGNGVHD